MNICVDTDTMWFSKQKNKSEYIFTYINNIYVHVSDYIWHTVLVSRTFKYSIHIHLNITRHSNKHQCDKYSKIKISYTHSSLL